MSLEELITIAGLSAFLLAACVYLFRYSLVLPPAQATPVHGLPFENGSAPFKAGPEGHPLPQWGAWDAVAVALIVLIGVYAAIVAGFVLFGAAVALISPGTELESLLESPGGGSVLQVILWCVMVGLPVLYLRGRGYLFDRVTFGFRGTRIGFAFGIWIAVMFACYLFIPALYTSLVESYELFDLPEQEIVEPFGLTWGGFVIAIITVAIATPVIEEFFFRGIIHQGLERRLGFIGGATASSAIFAFFHLPYFGLMPIFFSLGFGFAIMMRVTRSLWPAITGHFVVNMTGVIFSFEELWNG